MKAFFLLFLLTGCSLAWAQTNVPAANVSATNAPELELVIKALHGAVYDQNTNQIVYFGPVSVTYSNMSLACERLTVKLPGTGGNPTNILAQTNVVVDMVDAEGQRNHITAEQATYSITVLSNAVAGLVTNELIWIRGGSQPAKLVNTNGYVNADPIVIHVREGTVEFPDFVEMHFRETHGSGNKGTNGLPFKF
jgi:hypothetical protein